MTTRMQLKIVDFFILLLIAAEIWLLWNVSFHENTFEFLVRIFAEFFARGGKL